MAAEIVKVQRSLIPPDGPAMIYDRDRLHSEFREFRRLPVAVKAKLSRHPKVYCTAERVGDHWRLDGLAPDEDW
jgi:hypothetical protein